MYKSIRNQIEFLYSQYKEMTSEVLFNAQTDFLIDSIKAIPYCKNVLESLKTKHPIKDDLIIGKDDNGVYDRLPDIIYQSKEYFLSYCLHAYEFYKAKKLNTGHSSYLTEYYSDMRIFNQGVSSSGNRMQVFKTEFIWPLLCYVISNINEDAHIVYTLERYKQRVEMFSKAELHDNETLKPETYLQKDLALFLFDQNLEFHKEIEVGDGRIDFQIENDNDEHYGCGLSCNEKPYIVEIKRVTDSNINDFAKWMSQLSTYLGRLNGRGYLLLFVDKDIELVLQEEENIKINYIYTGKDSPSKLKHRITIQHS